MPGSGLPKGGLGSYCLRFSHIAESDSNWLKHLVNRCASTPRSIALCRDFHKIHTVACVTRIGTPCNRNLRHKAHSLEQHPSVSLSHDITTSLRSPCPKGKRRYSEYDAPEKPDNHRLQDMKVSIPNLVHTLDLHSPSPPKAYPFYLKPNPLKP